MLRSLHHWTASLRSKRAEAWSHRGIATPAPGSHPNAGNFANRPRQELSVMGRQGGKKGGKARGVGGFHEMDPEKQVWRSDSDALFADKKKLP